MSAPATIFGIYLGIGLVLLTIALATGKRRQQRAELISPATDGSEFGAGYLLFIMLLWPVWLIAMLTKE